MSNFYEVLRPRYLQDFIGNQQIFDPNTGFLKQIFSTVITPPSLILLGPPGSGKTSLGRLYKSIFLQFNKTFTKNMHFQELQSGKFTKQTLEDILAKQKITNNHEIIFIDEFHSLNVTQQATFLSLIESGQVTLIGATTESINHQIIPGLRSRMTLVELKSPTARDSLILICNCLNTLTPLDQTLEIEKQVEPEALALIARETAGDFRKTLQILQNSIINKQITLASATSALQQNPKNFSSKQLIYEAYSGLQKSIRCSDVNGAIFFFSLLIKCDEPLRKISRRLIIIASEDIGLADNAALQLAVSGAQGADQVGADQGKIVLAHVVCYLAKAPKSNSTYAAMTQALDFIEKNQNPEFLRPREGYREEKAGQNYVYAHDFGGQIIDSPLHEEVQKIKFFSDQEW